MTTATHNRSHSYYTLVLRKISLTFYAELHLSRHCLIFSFLRPLADASVQNAGHSTVQTQPYWRSLFEVSTIDTQSVARSLRKSWASCNYGPSQAMVHCCASAFLCKHVRLSCVFYNKLTYFLTYLLQAPPPAAGTLCTLDSSNLGYHRCLANDATNTMVQGR